MVVHLNTDHMLSSPRVACAFDEFNWGPENVDFGKTLFRDLNINARVFIFFFKLKKLPGAKFLRFYVDPI